MDATTARKYSTRRRSIVGAIADKLNEQDKKLANMKVAGFDLDFYE
jgi:hypothetical protein